MTTLLDSLLISEIKLKYLMTIKIQLKILILLIYKYIYNFAQDSHQLLEHALKINFGNVLRLQLQNDQNEVLQIFKKVCETDRELNHICIYIQQINRQDIQKIYLKELSFRIENLIAEFRKQRTIVQQLHLDTNDIKKQRTMIQMIIILCPQDLRFNPELFSLMLVLFKCLHKPDQQDIQQLERLCFIILMQWLRNYKLKLSS